MSDRSERSVRRARRLRQRGAVFGVAVAAFAGLAFGTGPARGAGLFISERGVRPIGRGGAMIAGADDLHATWLNPAGLADAETSAMLDLSVTLLHTNYVRRTNVADNAGAIRTVESPEVSSTTLPLPIPMLAGSLAFGERKEFTAALAVFAPNTPILNWPADVGGAPSPQRYVLLSFEGSALAIVGGYFAWKPIDELRVGVGLQSLVGTFQARTVFNANPADRLLGAPEDPSYDAEARLKVGPIFAPSANAGVTVVPSEKVRLGMSVQLPFAIRSGGTLQVRLPTAPVFDRGSQVGQDVDVKFNFPLIFRAGVEARPLPQLRVEAAYVREQWSNHRSIDLTPRDIQLVGVTGFPSPFYVAPTSLPKSYQDTHSFRLGGERRFEIGESENAFDLRAGLMYEPTAVPTDYVSAASLDSDKLIVGLGASYHLGSAWRFDAALSQIFMSEVTVDPSQGKIPRVNPVKGNPTDSEAVNGGTYSMRATILGLAAAHKF